MKAVLQRVLSASVTVEGRVISSIGKGLLVLVGIDRHDTPSDSSILIRKILSAKLFDDVDEGKMWRKSVRDIEGEVLCVSQFTLLANFKGAKPDFHESMSTLPGKSFYSAFLEELEQAYIPERIKDGEFGAMMQVALVNDGPVTIVLSSLDSRGGGTKSRGQSSGTQTPVTPGEAAQVQTKKVKGKGKERVIAGEGDTGPVGRGKEVPGREDRTGTTHVPSDASTPVPTRPAQDPADPPVSELSSLSVS